jgi:hypothetical protein
VSAYSTQLQECETFADSHRHVTFSDCSSFVCSICAEITESVEVVVAAPFIFLPLLKASKPSPFFSSVDSESSGESEAYVSLVNKREFRRESASDRFREIGLRSESDFCVRVCDTNVNTVRSLRQTWPREMPDKERNRRRQTIWNCSRLTLVTR